MQKIWYARKSYVLFFIEDWIICSAGLESLKMVSVFARSRMTLSSTQYGIGRKIISLYSGLLPFRVPVSVTAQVSMAEQTNLMGGLALEIGSKEVNSEKLSALCS